MKNPPQNPPQIQMTESSGAHFFSFLVLRNWFKWLQLTSWFLNTSAAKTSTFFLKMKTMWAEAVLALGIWIAGFLDFSISVGAKPLLLDKCLLKSLTKFCSQISVSDCTKRAVWDRDSERPRELQRASESFRKLVAHIKKLIVSFNFSKDFWAHANPLNKCHTSA